MEDEIKILGKLEFIGYGKKEDIEALSKELGKDIGEISTTEIVKKLINKYKEQKRDIRASHILLAKYSQKNEEQEKIIELMVNEIEINTSDDGVNLRPATLKEKIDYFKKKVRTSNETKNKR